MKKTLIYITLIIVVAGGYFSYEQLRKIYPFYIQLTQDRVGVKVDLQNLEQKNAHFVGSDKCIECHKENHSAWSHSRHPKMIQDPRKNPSVVVADFSKLPADANFLLKDAVYTIGGKFKQRFMMEKDFNGSFFNYWKRWQYRILLLL